MYHSYYLILTCGDKNCWTYTANNMKNTEQITKGKRWVVKIGSSLLTNDGQGLDENRIAGWVKQLAELSDAGMEIILVSSGAVATGMGRLGWTSRPESLDFLQAAAAVGQSSLVQCYQDCFNPYGYQTAQMLLTHDDLSNRHRYLNARNAMRTLLSLNVIPIINENDSIVTDEIRFGDNDTLAALVANLIEADALIILTDQQGLFDADPRNNPNAKLISQAKANDPLIAQFATGAGALGSGGMATKVKAAILAARSGSVTQICAGKESDVLLRLRKGEMLGTQLMPNQQPVVARKQWLAGHLQTRGVVKLDAGAAKALSEQGRSLLPVGVVSVEGKFQRGDAVSCVDVQGKPIAIGLINYDAPESRRLCKKPSSEIHKILGYVAEPELIHRDNLVIL